VKVGWFEKTNESIGHTKMRNTTMQRYAVWVLVAALWGGAMAAESKANLINIQFSNFPMHYDVGTQILADAASNLGGTGDITKASPLGPLTISVDGVVQDTYAFGDLLGDLLITGVSGIQSTGFSAVQATGPVGGFGLDLLQPSGQKLLSLNLTKPDVYYSATPSGQPLFVLTSGLASVNEQHLPGGIVFNPGDSVTFTLNATQFSHLATANGRVTSFDVSSVGSISGDGTVPEPSTLALLGALVIGLGWWAKRRAS
jgi:hypothetical protein